MYIPPAFKYFKEFMMPAEFIVGDGKIRETCDKFNIPYYGFYKGMVIDKDNALWSTTEERSSSAYALYKQEKVGSNA